MDRTSCGEVEAALKREGEGGGDELLARLRAEDNGKGELITGGTKGVDGGTAVVDDDDDGVVAVDIVYRKTAVGFCTDWCCGSGNDVGVVV